MTARITIDGNPTDDAEFGVSDTGKSWARLRVATHERIRQQDGTWESGPAQYFNVAVFDEAAERVANTFHKGDAVNVAGRIEIEEFDRRDGTRGVGIKVFARQVEPSERANRRTAPVIPADIAVQVFNPDDPTLPPLYEGPADGAHQALIPGIYRATTLDDEASERRALQPETATAAPAATRTRTVGPDLPCLGADGAPLRHRHDRRRRRSIRHRHPYPAQAGRRRPWRGHTDRARRDRPGSPSPRRHRRRNCDRRGPPTRRTYRLPSVQDAGWPTRRDRLIYAITTGRTDTLDAATQDWTAALDELVPSDKATRRAIAAARPQTLDTADRRRRTRSGRDNAGSPAGV